MDDDSSYMFQGESINDRDSVAKFVCHKEFDHPPSSSSCQARPEACSPLIPIINHNIRDYHVGGIDIFGWHTLFLSGLLAVVGDDAEHLLSGLHGNERRALEQPEFNVTPNNITGQTFSQARDLFPTQESLRLFDLSDLGLFLFPDITKAKTSTPLEDARGTQSEGSSRTVEHSVHPGRHHTPSLSAGSDSGTSAATITPELNCDKCGRACRDLKALSQHRRCHLKTHQCKAKGCDIRFSTRRDLARHEFAIHKKWKDVPICPYCKKMKGRPDNLKRHMKFFCSARKKG
ncbi:hypothetical protein B0H63DRAFT_473191 [Podospora didyma]|uniref:C2H2-type domain-containing protein n=1 Tax=Podospora didyma TaxID=330526 RepID=A0AAE0NQ30_9PEZI|nr:hypothetical protein B0H63DRAFT_473191 [Podospora didyma]